MGPLRFSRPPLILVHLLLASLAGGILCFSYCDGASLPDPAEDTGHTKDSVTKTMPVTAPSRDSMTENASASTDFTVDEKGLFVQQQPDKEKAVAGDDVIFSCSLSGRDPDGVSVQWEVRGLGEKHIVLEENQTSEDAFGGRAFLSGNPKAGDFSMMLRNVSRVDRGIYHCVLTFQNGSTVEGRGTKLSIREDTGQDESVGTLLGVIVAGGGVVGAIIAVTLTQFKDKLPCLKK